MVERRVHSCCHDVKTPGYDPKYRPDCAETLAPTFAQVRFSDLANKPSSARQARTKIVCYARILLGVWKGVAVIASRPGLAWVLPRDRVVAECGWQNRRIELPSVKLRRVFTIGTCKLFVW